MFSMKVFKTTVHQAKKQGNAQSKVSTPSQKIYSCWNETASGFFLNRGKAFLLNCIFIYRDNSTYTLKYSSNTANERGYCRCGWHQQGLECCEPPRAQGMAQDNHREPEWNCQKLSQRTLFSTGDPNPSQWRNSWQVTSRYRVGRVWVADQASDSDDDSSPPPQDWLRIKVRRFGPPAHQSKRFVRWLQDPVWAMKAWSQWAQMGFVPNKDIFRFLPTKWDTHLRHTMMADWDWQKSTMKGRRNCSAITGNDCKRS